MIECSEDFETRSDIDIKKRGAYVYRESPHHMPLMLAYSIDKAPIKVWTHHDRECPADLRAHIESGGLLRCYNAAFERGEHEWLADNWGWPRPRLEQFRCTAVQGAAMGLPRRLDKIGEALDIEMKKDRRGAALIKLFCVPRATSDSALQFNDDTTHPAEWKEFIAYCVRDVEAEREVASRLAPLSDHEWRVYALNERINDRGLRIDVKSARAALRLIEKAKTAINDKIAKVTNRAVMAITQVAKLKAWIEAQGVEVSGLDAESIHEYLHSRHDIPNSVIRALELRQEGAKPSTDKITAMLNRVSEDGRARGVYLHHGAGQTGRFSSRGIQAHNMPRYRKCFEDAHLDLTTMFEAIQTEDPRMLKLLYGEELGRPLHLMSDCVRSFIWASPGKTFVVADYSSIEGRIAAWIAGETWKVEAYRALDRGEGHGIYELTAAGIYGVLIELVTKAMRQVGKVAELSLGYQGGVGAIARFCRQNGIRLAPLLAALWELAEEIVRTKASKRFDERIEKHDATALSLGRDGWIAGELIKVGWREKHPRIVNAWSLLEEAAVSAVESPGTIHRALGASFLVRHDFLWLRLHSGRCLAYGKPRMMEVEAPWADPTLEPAAREKKRSLTARSVDPDTETWKRFPLYGGSLFNNVVQGNARDILVYGMENAEAAGYPVNLQTHDEIGAEMPAVFDARQLEAILCQLPPWAAGLPMAAAGFTGKRYRKA